MQLGMIGLGRMGANIARRVAAAGHECVVYDHDPDAVKAMAEEKRTTGVFSLEELAEKMTTPRVVWVMVPAGDITTSVIEELAKTLESGDIVIDGGNSYYRDDLKHSKLLSEKGIHLLDCGTSGGVWGRERGYCLMIGGDDYAFEHAEPLFATIAPGVDAAPRTPGRTGEVAQAENGYLHCGPSGAGHFVKMVHNGIEYGMMASLAEGLNILRNADIGTRVEKGDAETAPLSNPECYRYNFDIEDVAELWRRERRRVLAARPDRERVARVARAVRVLGAGLRLRGRSMDRDRGDRRGRSRAGAHDGAAVPLRLAQLGRLRQQGAVCDAQAVRRARREAGQLTARVAAINSARRTSPRRR